MISINTHHILITGVSSGIGYALVKKFLSLKNCVVIGTVRQVEDKLKLEEEFGNRLKVFISDVQDMESILLMKEGLQKEGISSIDCLINNAGIIVPGPLQNLSMKEFELQMDVNVNGVIRFTNTFLPMLGAELNSKKAPGKIINMSSVSGLFNSPFLGAYCISKHALESISDIYRRELSIYGIGVVCIEPGPIKSEIWDKATSNTEKFKKSDFAPILKGMLRRVEKSKKDALDSEILAQKLLNIYLAKRNKARYIITKKKWANYAFYYLVPTQIKDYLIKKTLRRKILSVNA